MPHRQILRTILAPLSAAALTLSTHVQAHEGHGLPGISHWHGSDVWGFVAVGGIAALAYWLGGRK